MGNRKHKKISAQIVCPSSEVWDFDEKRLHWASIVCALAVLDRTTNSKTTNPEFSQIFITSQIVFEEKNKKILQSTKFLHTFVRNKDLLPDISKYFYVCLSNNWSCTFSLFLALKLFSLSNNWSCISCLFLAGGMMALAFVHVHLILIVIVADPIHLADKVEPKCSLR